MAEDRHSGDDDKQTDHLDKGSDGHTVESGDEKWGLPALIRW